MNNPVKFHIEGRFRKSSTPTLIASIMQSNPGGLPVVLGLDSTSVAGHGNFDISNYKQDGPVDDTITYTCDMDSNGDFTPNA